MENKNIYQNIVTGIIGIIILISIMGLTQAAVFNVYTTVCAPEWYCTAFDHGDCGTRTCIDTNGCGSVIGKPSEYLECEETSSGGGGGGTSYTIPETIGLPPEGYFTLNTDNIKVTIEQGIVVQKIIQVNGSKPAEYHLEIMHPTIYTNNTEFITTSTETKQIDSNGDFNIIIDSREIIIGTYVVPIRIYTEDYSEIVGLTIDVVPAMNAEIEISLDSKVKNLGMDEEILTFVRTKGLELNINTIFTYNILDPLGNTVSTEELEVSDPSRIEHSVLLPSSLGEGYYALSVKITQNNKTYVKSEQFTLLTPNKYLPVTESPGRSLTVWIWVVIIIAAIVTLFNTGLFYKSYAPTKHRLNRNINAWKMSHRPSIGIKDRLASLFKKKPSEDKPLDVKSRMDRLKESYQGGFITAKEYKDIARRYGYNVMIADNKTTDKESVETALKHAEEKKEEKENISTEKKIPITLSNAINIPVEKESDAISKNMENKTKTVEKKLLKEETIAIYKEKKSTITPVAETPVTNESVGGAISHMFAQSIIDKKAHHDQAFVLNNHERLYSIRDLLEALPKMPISVFEHHTQNGRNDFANWIGDVFQYYDIAEELRKAKTKEEFIEKIKRFE